MIPAALTRPPSRSIRGRSAIATFAFFILAALLPTPGAAQGRIGNGRVVDAATMRPITGAQVLVDGAVVAVSDDSGRFVLRATAAGGAVTVRAIGYSPQTRQPAADGSALLFMLRKDALQLDRVVITGHATGVSRRHAPTSTAVVEAADLTRTSTTTIEHALQGKVPGAQISQRTGAPGGGNWVRIRGSSTVTGESNPLYVVDGIIVSDDRISNGQNIVTRAGGRVIAAASQDAPVNRIADLNPAEIERIEVLRGPSAAAIYGSKASNGVVLITTKQGRAGAARINVTSGVGTSALATRVGRRRFTSAAAADSAFPGAAAWFDPAVHLDYDRIAYGARPVHRELAVDVSGGTPTTRYYLAVGDRHEGGIVRRTFADKRTLRLNLTQRVQDRVDVGIGLSAIVSHADRGLFGNDNNGSSVGYALPGVPAFVDVRRRADGTWPDLPWLASNPLQTIALIRNDEVVTRGVLTSRIEWRAVQAARHSLRLLAVGGGDVSAQRNEVFSPPELQYEPLDGNAGTASASENRTTLANLNLNLVHVWQPKDFVLTTQVGTQYERNGWGELRVAGENLLGGLETAGAGALSLLNDFRGRTVDFGVFAQSEWLWRDRLLLTLGARADRSSNNSDVQRFFVYPKASVAYTLDAPFPGVVDELKLRVAAGATGNRPSYGLKFSNVIVGSVGGQPSVGPSTTRTSPDVRPERQQEVEWGADAVLFGHRGLLDVTAFRRAIDGMFIPLIPAPSSGYTAEIGNGADMRMWGLEAAVTAVPVAAGPFEWTTRLSFGRNRAEITRLAVPSFTLGTSLLAGLALIEVGKSPTTILGSDTLPEPGRIVTQVELGDGNPRWTGGWSHELRWRRLTLFALLDHQSGGLINAGTWARYVGQRNTADYDVPTASGLPLGEVRARALGAVSRIRYVDATYTKLRELALSVELPDRLLDVLSGARSGSLRLSGRNLLWWTRVRGVDPEAENFGGGGVAAALQRNRELGAYPASRTFWLTLNLSY